MLLRSVLILLLTLVFTKAQNGTNGTCPTEETRQNTLRCFTYPQSSCVTDTGVYSNTTNLYIGESRVVTLESELRLFKVLNMLLAEITGVQEDCLKFYQTLACLYLFTPCYEEKPLRLCAASCDALQKSQCTLTDYLFNYLTATLGKTVFDELSFTTCDDLNDRVDGYPEIPGVDYSGDLECTYVGLPGSSNGHGLQGHVHLVTDSTFDSTNIHATSSHGVVQVLDLYANIWGDVCIEEGTSQAEINKIAQVVCRSIGYPGMLEEPFVGAPSTSSGYYMVSNLTCTGDESELSHCQHNGYDFKSCSRDRRLHVNCSKETGDIELSGEVQGDHTLSGIPVIHLDGVKVEFCADSFTEETGRVICRFLNVTSPNLTVTFEGVPEEADIELVTYKCSGDEMRILQCELQNQTCSPHDAVFLTCSEDSETRTTDHAPTLSAMDSIILAACVIIFVLLLTICIVIILFYQYRKRTQREILETRTKVFSGRVETTTSFMENNGVVRNNSFTSNTTRPIIHYDYNQTQVQPLHRPGNINAATVEQRSSVESQMSPIQNYMVTTLGADNLPSEVDLTINYINEYCGHDISDYYIPMERLEVGGKIGEGAFGVVHKGRILDMPSQTDLGEGEEVAIKTLKEPFKDEELKELLLECSVLKDLQHANIVGLLALTYCGRRPYVIIPFMEKGDLKAYLKSVREKALNAQEFPDELSEVLLARMSLDITRGMEYMTNKRYVHRDLAARNCVLDARFNVKVSDFGLSREIYVDDYYRHVGGRLPAKWMSPESLDDGIYNEKTDVWAFGVTLWEIYSLGRNPYPGVGNSEILKFLQDGNKRMEMPKLCPVEIYDLMQYCWQYQPGQRPTFRIVTTYLESLKILDGSPDKNECQEKALVAIKEEDDKLQAIEYIECNPNRRQLLRQEAVSPHSGTPYTTSRAMGFEQLASRIDKPNQKAFMMKCVKSVSMDSNRFSPCEHYNIPYLSISIPITDPEHLERTRTLGTVRTKQAQDYKPKRNTCIGGGETAPIDEDKIILFGNRLRVPPPPPQKKHKNKPRLGKSLQFPSQEDKPALTRTT